MSKLYRDKEWLHNEYITQSRTMTDIANQFGITPMAIQLWLDKHEIPTRPRGGGVRQGEPRLREETIMIPLHEYNRLIEIENKWRGHNG